MRGLSRMEGAEKEFVKEITRKEEDFSQWYIDVITKAELADYYPPVKGCMVIKPYGYAIWERIQEGLNRRFKATGHQNAYFPVFIPESFLRREAEHVEGFAPEVAWVTAAGTEPLEERLAVRPTSETVICSMYRKWIQSYRDLPLLLNQWCNVVRWEKTTRPFLRTTEFLWQEGHTAHRTEAEAEEETLRMLEVYREFLESELAIPTVVGRKTESEKFAGALRTYSVEALMSDGRALQAGTSHNLGQHFARVFDITYLDSDGQLKHVWQTSWGVSTRLIGALIMVHGDDRGLALPPRVAPIQVVIVPIAPRKERPQVMGKAVELASQLQENFRVRLDDREEYTPGWKYNDWEMRGVPLRVEIGPRDLRAGQVVLVRRDTGARVTISRAELIPAVGGLLDDIQQNMLDRARRFLEENTRRAENINQLEEIVSGPRGLVLAGWCGSAECEAAVKERTKATIRNIPFRQEKMTRCVCCEGAARYSVIFARAY